MKEPTKVHRSEVKRVLRYLQRTSTYGLLLKLTNPSHISAYSDANWAESVEDENLLLVL